AYIYWLNLVLAGFNLLPAFPMDGGRVLRAILSYCMSYKKATDIAVRMGHVFALFFAYLGIVHGQIFLLVIAIFIYMSASSEGLQVNVRETIKNYTVKNILAGDFVHISPDAPLSKILELAFRTRQEDYPVIEDGYLRGFVTRKELLQGIHAKGKEARVSEVMRTDIPAVTVTTGLHEVQKLLQKYDTSAMPVKRAGSIVGVVTIDDINRVYLMISEK
ncbi:MAG: CBS domain-containing protein, partial [Candidatus Omnitrophica bacterium]|nr:CBS domain-containing protein [Candidatus Omnitrophota bacterium]